MRLEITLEYFTVPGENLYLMLRDGDEILMEYASAGRWTASFEVPDGTDVLEYSFELRRGGKTIRREWRGRKVAFPATPAGKRGSVGEAAINEYLVRDRWQDRPEDSPFWMDAFRNVIFKSRTAYAYQSERFNVSLVVPDAQVRGDEVLALAGSGSLFEEDWGWFIPFSNEGDGLWRVDLDVEEPFDYKVVVLDSTSGKPKIWENGDNHRFTDVPAEGEFIEVRDVVPFFETRRWKGAGTAVPVFSLRSEDSFGVGEFNDLKKLADWAAATGQRVIQLLPINDTTMTGTWTDSYPYNVNSTFALHPQFIHLPAAGVKMGRKYKAMCKELNDLPAIDYERVNGEKIRLMREAFAEVGKEVMSGAAYRSFFAANKSWLVPYAVFRVLTDINGTPEFGKWKTLSEYSETKVVNFRRNHRVEVDFYCYVQFCLDAQLKEAVEYAHSKGIIIKGDLPIGISRTSADAWQFPHLFNLDSQAGAPPDAFSVDGQNWGFPTYNWEEMAKDGYAWWKARLGKMSEYFDAFRIDHILGFFRIWEIPLGIKSGLQGHFNPALPYSENEIREKGFDPHSQLFVSDPHRKGWFHPRISAQDTGDFLALEDWRKDAYNDLYYDFFYRRHNAFWKECAMRKLPELLDSTGMLACGEDLGMIPACVPEVMKDLRILSLEIQRMPKSPDRVFDDPASYPYLSVCATGTHDTSTLRGWWQEDRPMTGRFYHEVLHCEGQAPHDCEPWVCEIIVKQHLDSPSMLCVLPIQDWMSIDGEVRYQGRPEDERINIPANSRHYWRWRMHITLENLLSRSDFNRNLRNLVSDSGRA